MATNDIGRVTPIWRGFYSAATTYELNDIVIDTAGSVWWHKSEELTTGVIPEAGEIWDAVIDMSIFSGLIQAAITTAQTALAAAQAALADVAADMERAETAADNAENSAAAASESAAGVGALAQAAAASAEAAAGSATGAAGSAQAAAGSKSDAEAYAVGTRGGEDVETTDPTYHNNAKYYAEQAASEAEAAAQSAEDAQDVLDSIPADYSQLSADVGDLKTQIIHMEAQFPDINGVILPPSFARVNRYVDGTEEKGSENVARLSFAFGEYIELKTGDIVKIDTSVISMYFGGYSTDNGANFTIISSRSNDYTVPANGIYFFTMAKVGGEYFTEDDETNGWKYIAFSRPSNLKNTVSGNSSDISDLESTLITLTSTVNTIDGKVDSNFAESDTKFNNIEGQFPGINGVVFPPAFVYGTRYVDGGEEKSNTFQWRMTFKIGEYITLKQGDIVSVDRNIIDLFAGGYSTDGGTTFVSIATRSNDYTAPADGIYFFWMKKPNDAYFTEDDLKKGFYYISFKRNGSMRDDVSKNASDIEELNNTFDNIYDYQNRVLYENDVSGTTFKNETISLSAGKYLFHVDNIDSEDETDNDSLVLFMDTNTTILSMLIDRTNGFDGEITLSGNINHINFYAAKDGTVSANVPFEFNNVRITDISELYKRIESKVPIGKTMDALVEDYLNPYSAVIFAEGSDQYVKARLTTHAHCEKPAEWSHLSSANLDAYAVSNYYPSYPTYPFGSDSPFMNYTPRRDGVEPFGGSYDGIQIPNAEQAGFTDGGAYGRMHANSLGSLFESGNSQPGTPGSGVNTTWKNAFAQIKSKLLYPTGGGVTINHPSLSNIDVDSIIKMLDFDESVLGIEIYNGNGGSSMTANDAWAIDIWDEILTSGRRCWGFAVPDHRAQDVDTWTGIINTLVPEASQRNILDAIRNGMFYAQIKRTNLAVTNITVTKGKAIFEVNATATLTAIANGEVVGTATGTSLMVDIPDSAVYVRFEATVGTINESMKYSEVEAANGDKIFTNPIMLKQHKRMMFA